MWDYCCSNDVGVSVMSKVGCYFKVVEGLGSIGGMDQGFGVFRNVGIDRCWQCVLYYREEMVNDWCGIFYEGIGFYCGICFFNDEVIGEYGLV